MKIGEAGKLIENSHPTGDDKENVGWTMLRRAPSAKKPVNNMNSRTIRGNKALLGVSGPVDLIRLTRKNRTPDSIMIPKISVNRDNSLAGIMGRVNANWARIMMIMGMVNPQNRMRWAIPAYRFFKIFLCPRIYPRRPARLPGRSSFRPIRHKDLRLARPTNIIIMAIPMSKKSKEVNNGLSPLVTLDGLISYDGKR